MTDAEAIALAQTVVSAMFHGKGTVTRTSAEEQNKTAKILATKLGIDIPLAEHEQIRVNFSTDTPIGKKSAHVVIVNNRIVSGMASG